MKKFVVAMVIIIVIGIVLAGIGCAVAVTTGFKSVSANVEYIEKSFETEEAFTKLDLDLEDNHNVMLERGDKCTVKYFESDITKFSINVKNGALVISEDSYIGLNWVQRIFYKSQRTDIVITMPEVESLDIDADISGAVDINLPSWKYGKIDLDVSGASKVIANNIIAASISLDASGATDMTLSGRANSLKTRASGAVRMSCDGFDCPQIDVRASGSTELNLSGIGDVLNVHASGSGKIWARNFTLNRAELDASGSVNAELNVSTLLKVDASGSAKISYWGNPTVDRHTSGSAKITKMD